jgi:hypothetical protein
MYLLKLQKRLFRIGVSAAVAPRNSPTHVESWDQLQQKMSTDLFGAEDLFAVLLADRGTRGSWHTKKLCGVFEVLF